MIVTDNKGAAFTMDWLRSKTAHDFFYIASPYSHPDPAVMAYRARKVQDIEAALLRNDVIVYSPIGSCYDKAYHNDLPKDFVFWQRVNDVFIDKSTGIIVVKLDGWRESKGVTHEINYCITTHKQILYLEP